MTNMSEDTPHPFDPLSPEEINRTAKFVRKAFPTEDVYFRVITLSEPSKTLMVEYLNAEHNDDNSLISLPRLATVQLYLGKRNSQSFYEIKVNLEDGSIVEKEQLLGRHSHVDSSDMIKFEEACLRDERVLAAIREMELPEGATVCIEPWTYATDGMNDMSQKISMCYFYMRLSDHPDANLYAYPLDLCAEISGDLQVLKVYWLPTDFNDPSSSSDKSSKSHVFDRRKIHNTSEYHPALQHTAPRTTTKPIHITQPSGPSFTITGNQVNWENFTFRVGFNYREGLTLHDVRYNHQPLFYRISLSEMFVPYADPRSPYTRKAAFDLGSDGAGVNANNLLHGCNCLGSIQYFSAWHNTSSGLPLSLPNVVCVHEVDDGLLWKHTNHRTNHPVLARSRVLILQTIITVSNYEYIFAFHFGQDASIHYEVRATGILSTVPIPIDLDTSSSGTNPVPYGITIAPGVMAPYHQHLFCLRIDPFILGTKNTLFIEESHPLPSDPTNPPPNNPHGVGYTTNSTPVESESGHDLNHFTNRTFKILNESHINPVTNTFKGYKLVPSYCAPLLAHPESYHAKRSEFGKHAVWVTRYHESELYAAGKHTMQSLGGEGLGSWIEGRRRPKEAEKNGAEKKADIPNGTATTTSDLYSNGNANGTNGFTNGTHENKEDDPSNVRNQDIVLWHTFGSTHNPRIEDWPVMPCEKFIVGLKPINFFTGNPGMDCVVPTSPAERNGCAMR